jgi:hypothetical protein
MQFRLLGTLEPGQRNERRPGYRPTACDCIVVPELEGDQIIDADKVQVSIDQQGVLADIHQRRIAMPSTELPAERDTTTISPAMEAD